LAQLNDKYTQKERVKEKEEPKKKWASRQCENAKEEGESTKEFGGVESLFGVLAQTV
jgi:hypothetical protein